MLPAIRATSTTLKKRKHGINPQIRCFLDTKCALLKIIFKKLLLIGVTYILVFLFERHTIKLLTLLISLLSTYPMCC